MFTGIINDIGTVVDLNEDILTVSFNNNIYTNLDPGTSIAIDGCCLTLKEYRDGNLVFQVSNETFTRTALNNNHCGTFTSLRRSGGNRIVSTTMVFIGGMIMPSA